MISTTLVSAIFIIQLYSFNAFLTSQTMIQTSRQGGAGNASVHPIKTPAASLDACNATQFDDETIDLEQLRATGKALKKEFASISSELDMLMATLVPNDHFREVEWPGSAQKRQANARR